MKSSRLIAVAALAAALTQTAMLPAAYAEDAPFRTAAPQTFSAADMQRYGLDAQTSQRAVALQEQGYDVRVLTPAEAQQMTAGMSDNQWLLLGILAGVIVIAFAVS